MIPLEEALLHISGKLVTQFSAGGISDGFLYSPIELEGLSLINPLIPLFYVHKSSIEDPMDVVAVAIELEEEDIKKAKKAYLEGSSHPKLDDKTARNDSFIMLDE